MVLSIPPLRILCVISLLELSRPAFAADTQAWKSRSIYQILTDRFARTDRSTTHKCNTTASSYCGGTWKGTIGHLDYIQGMGFDAVIISPIVENIKGSVSSGEAYLGYWPKDLYSLNAHFGTHQDLLDLSDALHKRDMYLMMDTVVNNMAYILKNNQSVKDIDYSIYNPFNNPKYFHPYCKIADHKNASLAQVQRCWTGDWPVLHPDLKTEDPTVQNMLGQWIKDMISTYSIDGLRIASANHINPAFLPIFHNAVDSFIIGDIPEKSTNTICTYQKKYLPSVANYPTYFAILEAFTRGNTTALTRKVEIMTRSCPDTTTLVSFSENQDVSRIASFTKDIVLAKNILTFTLLSDGIPQIYQGQEQHFAGASPPQNRAPLWPSAYNTTTPLYTLIATLNRIRKHASAIDASYLATKSYPLYTGGSEIVLRKGSKGRQVIVVLSTQGTDGGQYGMRLPVTYEPGVVAMDVLRCVEYTVNGQAELVVRMDRGEPRVLFPVELMDGSGLCGFAFEKGGKGSYKSAEVGGAGGQRVRVSGLVRVVVAVGVVLCSGYVGAW